MAQGGNKPEEKEKEVLRPTGFAMADTEAEYEAVQVREVAKHTAILESVQDEAFVEANRQFVPQKQAATKVLFNELDAKTEGVKGSEPPQM
ncbi:hypothetical protein D1007_35407 [Hordeum vulgare]|nr:hypothetical protein D1007_35407 [Hordeum vulgare]